MLKWQIIRGYAIHDNPCLCERCSYTSSKAVKRINGHFLGNTRDVDESALQSSTITDMYRSKIGVLGMVNQVVVKCHTAQTMGQILEILADLLTCINVPQVAGGMWRGGALFPINSLFPIGRRRGWRRGIERL